MNTKLSELLKELHIFAVVRDLHFGFQWPGEGSSKVTVVFFHIDTRNPQRQIDEFLHFDYNAELDRRLKANEKTAPEE